jgi:hypothetical protein
MTDFDKEEFWKALGRLYDTTVELRIASARQLATSKQDGERILTLLRIAEFHDRRVTKLENPGAQES